MPQGLPPSQPPQEMERLRQLLMASAQGQGQNFNVGAPAFMRGSQNLQANALRGVDTSALIEAMNASRGNRPEFEAYRGVVEGRTSDDIARGPASIQPEPVVERRQRPSMFQALWNAIPFNRVGNAMGEALHRAGRG